MSGWPLVRTPFYNVGYIRSEFAFKKTSASRLLVDKQAGLRLQIDPASEKTRSDVPTWPEYPDTCELREREL